jgi:hypothetical protein
VVFLSWSFSGLYKARECTLFVPVWGKTGTNSPAIAGRLVMASWHLKMESWGIVGCWGRRRDPHFFCAFPAEPVFSRMTMNSDLKRRRFPPRLFSICLLNFTFSNWAPVQGKSLFF